MEIQGCTARHWMHQLACMPREDFFACNAAIGVGVVCDGVTRDPTPWLPDKTSLLGKLQFALCYERPSRAGIVSRMCAETICDYVSLFSEQHAGTLWFGMQKANQFVYQQNCTFGLTQERVDYLRNNYAGCVAAAALIVRGEAHWAYLADCGVAVVDAQGNLRERTPDEGPSVHDRERWQHPKLQDKEWRNPKARSFIRKTFVNKPRQEYSYGTLNGEVCAMQYVRTGSYRVCERDMVLAYSDGAAEVLFKADGDLDGVAASVLSSKDWHALRVLLRHRVRSEGTLVYLRLS